MAEFTAEQLAALVQAATDSTMTNLIKTGAIKSPTQKRERVNWERQLIYEYLAKFYPEIPHWIRIEIGANLPGREDPIYTKTRRWADAIVRMPDHMLIIEGKMQGRPDVVAQLLNYKRLLPSTPLFKKYADLPIKLQMVVALIDDDTKQFVEDSGIEVVVYKPANYEAWYKQRILKNKDSA